MSTESRIRKEVSKGKIVVSRVYTNEYQKEGTQTAELKQVVTTKSYYPTKSISNSLQDNAFSMTDFGFKDKEYDNSEKRVTWIDVPTGLTLEQVQAKIDSIPNANLYKILSNHPILSDTEQYAVLNSSLNVTKDTYANRQAVRYGAESENAGDLVLDTVGKVQYKRNAFSTTAMADQDMRTASPSDFYASAEIKAELGLEVPALAGQSIG